MSGLEFELTFNADELKKLDLPVEIRKPNMVLVQRARSSERVELEPGTYYVGIKMPAGPESWSQVTVPGEGYERIRLGPESGQTPASQTEELQEYFTPSYVPPPSKELSYLEIIGGAALVALVSAVIAYLITGSELTTTLSALAGGALVVALSPKVLRPGYTAVKQYTHDVKLRQFSGNVLTGECKLDENSSLFSEQIPLTNELIEIDFEGKNQGQIIQLLQTGEKPLNVILPAWQERGCRIVLKRQPDARYSLEVHLKHAEAELLLRYWEQGYWQLAANVSDSIAVSAEQLLHDKLQHPISAAIGSYALLRLGALERLHDWSENLMNRFTWLPDGAAVRGEHLARLGKHHEALQAFCQLRERGLPYLSDGLSYAVERLRHYQSVGKKRFSEDDLQKCAATLALLEPFSYFTDFSKLLTTFTGLDPSKPDDKSLGAPPMTYPQVVDLVAPPSQIRIYEKPVAWLLGKQLLGGIKGMLLYTAYGAKLDPRDWMTPTVENFATPEAEAKSEFWFDYMSDVGDGTKAMYGIAYLALSNLWTKLDASSTQLPQERADLEVSTRQEGRTFRLPRGEFLFIGGDTAYHASDYLSLVNRIQRPFNYAYVDLKSQNLISDDEPRRPVFGIPGNHDYYDQIDGFRRQFRKPTREEGPLPPKRSGGNFAQLTLAGFRRVQEASYVALRLPFDWWLWGLDTESVSDRREQHLDRRQEHFFKNLSKDGNKFKAPDKLILATSAPSTVFGQIAGEDNQRTSKPLKSIGISRPFLPKNSDLSTSGDAELKTGQCRLDLSGDVHHYARYWGPKSDTVPRKHNTAPQPSANSYASVVSGAGGAFHHPSTTYDNEICEQVLYPPEDVSRKAVADRLFKFWNVLHGGYVWLAGLIIAFTIYFGVTVPKSSREFISNFGILNTLRLTEWERIGPTILQLDDVSPCAPIQPFSLWTRLGVVSGEWRPTSCTPANPGYFFPEVSTWPPDLIVGQIFIFVSLAAALTLFGLSVFSKWIFDDNASPFEKKTPNTKLVPIVAGIALLTIVGLLTVQPYRDHITPFVSSLIVLYSIVVAITAIAVNMRYSEYVFRKSFVPAIDTGLSASVSSFIDEYFPWALWVLAIMAVSFGLWFFGKNNLPSYLISDIVFFVVLVGATVGIILLSFLASGALSRQNKIVRFVGKLLIGVWHLLLQLLVPFVLVKLGSWVDWGLAAILLVLPIPLARYLLSKNSRAGLSVLWLLYGAVMLTLPYITGMFLPLPPVFTGITGWTALVPALFAGAFGAILCCLWTGWYFAICFAFNGHNNEVGGAARIEEFKEFIRFRLTPEGLTGYVIALNNVSIVGELDRNGRIMDGSDLQPKLIDVFHLTPKPAAPK